MKKQLRLTVAAVLLALCMSFGLSACTLPDWMAPDFNYAGSQSSGGRSGTVTIPEESFTVGAYHMKGG